MRERRIFQKAIDLRDLQQRDAYLRKACGNDTALLMRTERLLQSAQQMGNFLAAPVLEPASTSNNGQVSTTIHAADNLRGRALPIDDDFEASNAESDPASSSVLAAIQPLLEPSEEPGSLGRIAHYEILRVLVQGAFGIVLQGKDAKLQRLVAIKVLLPSLASTSPPRKRFLREARAAASIRHEQVVSVYSVEEEPLPYLVMEYIAGQNLQERIDEAGPLDLCEILPLARQLLSGLEAAHDAGIVHRDIKPSNILLENGVKARVKITDFGLARTVDDARLTQSGYVAGTPMYMSPEQAQGNPIDARSDLFGVGSVLYVMLTGRPPFRAPTTLAVLKRVVDEAPRPIEQIAPETPEWIRRIIGKLHAKKPSERFQSAMETRELWEACETRWLRGEPISDELRRKWSISADPFAAAIPEARRPSSTIRGIRKGTWIAATIFIFMMALSGITLLAMQYFNRIETLTKKSNDAPSQTHSTETVDSKVGAIPKPASKENRSSSPLVPQTVNPAISNRESLNADVQPIEAIDYRLIRGATCDELVAWAKELGDSFIPHSLNPRHGTNPTLIDAVAIPNSSNRFWQLHSIVDPEADFEKMYRSHRPAWRMQVLAGNGSPIQTVFLWVSDIPFWRTFNGSREQIHAHSKELSVEVFFPSSLFRCRTEQIETWSLTQSPLPEFEFSSLPDIGVKELEIQIDQFRGRDWIPIRMMQHVGLGEPRFAAVFRKNPEKTRWEYTASISEEEWDDELKNHRSKGMYPAIVASSVADGKISFRVIWSSAIDSK